MSVIYSLAQNQHFQAFFGPHTNQQNKSHYAITASEVYLYRMHETERKLASKN